MYVLARFQLMIVDVSIGGQPVRMLSVWSHLVTPMQEYRSTKVFSAKSYFSPIRESFLPQISRYTVTREFSTPVQMYGCM